MEAIITIITIIALGLLVTFVGQLFKGVDNIFTVFGRVAGWVFGIVIILFFIKVFLFG